MFSETKKENPRLCRKKRTERKKEKKDEVELSLQQAVEG
jgi:hypothetical protein